MGISTKATKQVGEKVGAAINLDYLQRIMKAYPVTENEIKMLDHYSGQKALFFAVATFFLGLACEVLFHATFTHGATPTPEAHLLGTWGVRILFVLAGVFAVAGGVAWWRGHTTWEVIRGESQKVVAK